MLSKNFIRWHFQVFSYFSQKIGFYSTDRSKAVVLVLLLCGLFYEVIVYLLPCVILFLCFSVLLALRLPCLGKKYLILVLFCMFVRFALVWFCLFFSSSWSLGRFVIVALPGLFTYLFFFMQIVPLRENLHEMSLIYPRKLICMKWQSIFWGKQEKKNAVCWNFYPAC